MHHKDLIDYIESGTDRFNSLTKFIPYNPSFYNYIGKYQQKQTQLELKSEEFLPNIMINEKLQHKIKYHKQFKQAYGLTNLLQFETTITLDLISYDIEEGYQNKMENDELYPVLLNFSSDKIIQELNTNSSLQLNSLCNHFESQANSQNTNNLELVYLNLFKISLYTHTDNKITTFLKYPSLSFKLQEIRHTNKFVETPLTRVITKSRQLSSQKKDKPQYKFGFLSLDQSNRIFPIMSQDPLVHQLPLIGSWIYSNDPYDEPIQNRQFIWCMLAEYITSSFIKQRICKDAQDQFLFIQFQKNQSPQFFEVKLQEDPSYKIVRKQERVINLDNYMIDLASAQPINYLEKPIDLLATNIKNYEEQSFNHDSSIKQPPLPVPHLKEQIILDNNSSYSSAHFANQSLKLEQELSNKEKEETNSSITERLVIIQSEQLKLMQTQILDLQRALLQQYVNPQQSQFLQMDPRLSNQYSQIPPLNNQSVIEQTFQQQQQIFQQKYQSFQQQQQQQYQQQNLHQQQQQFPQQQSQSQAQSQYFQQVPSNQYLRTEYQESFPQHQYYNSNSYTKQSKVYSPIANQQVKQDQDIPSPFGSRITLPVQKIDFLNEQLKLKTQSRKKEQEIEDIAQIIVGDKSYKESFIFSSRNSMTKVNNSSHSQLQNTSSQEKKGSLHDLLLPLKDSGLKNSKIDQNPIKPQEYEKVTVKENVQVNQMIQNKENRNANILEQSAGSKMMPKIKFNLKDCEDSDSDAEIKKLEMKYLKKRL